jgi:hypothetical protein
MTGMTKDKESLLLGRVLKIMYPEIAADLLTKIKPLSSDLTLLPKILEGIDLIYEDLEMPDKKILFVAVAHKMYSPACLFDKYVAKLPTGLRDEMAQCLGYVNSEMINFNKSFVYPHLKNPRYLNKMQRIIDYVLGNQQELDNQAGDKHTNQTQLNR